MKATAALLAIFLFSTTEDDLARRAAAVKPSASELTWSKVPRVLSLAESRKMAQQEKRPIFLWAAGDDPLERC